MFFFAFVYCVLFLRFYLFEISYRLAVKTRRIRIDHQQNLLLHRLQKQKKCSKFWSFTKKKNVTYLLYLGIFSLSFCVFRIFYCFFLFYVTYRLAVFFLELGYLNNTQNILR